MSLGGGGSAPAPAPTQQTVRQVQDMPEYFQPYMERLFQRSESTFNEPYQTYTAPRIAPYDPFQTQAHAGIAGLVGTEQPYIDAATSYTTQGAQSFPTANMPAYMNPYQQQVTDIAVQAAREQGDLNKQALAGLATKAGAFGGSRFGLQSALQERETERLASDIQARGSQAAFETGRQAWLADQQRATEAGKQMAALGGIKQNLGLQGYAALGDVGAARQAADQTALNIGYEDWARQVEWPRRQIQDMTAVLRGFDIPASSYQSSVSQVPTPSLSQSLLGAGLGGLAVYKMLGYKKGGRVKRYSNGGLASIRKFANGGMTSDDIRQFYGIYDPLTLAQIQAESGGWPQAVSRKGATGLMQLKPSTFNDMYLRYPKAVGRPALGDPVSNIAAGQAYTAEQLAKYGNLDDALAAYNWGPGNVDKWIALGRNPELMPMETKGYIKNIKAGLPAGYAEAHYYPQPTGLRPLAPYTQPMPKDWDNPPPPSKEVPFWEKFSFPTASGVGNDALSDSVSILERSIGDEDYYDGKQEGVTFVPTTGEADTADIPGRLPSGIETLPSKLDLNKPGGITDMAAAPTAVGKRGKSEADKDLEDLRRERDWLPLALAGMKLMSSNQPNLMMAVGEAGVEGLKTRSSYNKLLREAKAEAAKGNYYEAAGKHLEAEDARKAELAPHEIELKKAQAKKAGAPVPITNAVGTNESGETTMAFAMPDGTLVTKTIPGYKPRSELSYSEAYKAASNQAKEELKSLDVQPKDPQAWLREQTEFHLRNMLRGKDLGPSVLTYDKATKSLR